MANILYRGNTPSSTNSSGAANRPLTNDEIDKNFYALNVSKLESGDPTLATVTANGSSTSTNLTLNGNNTLGNNSSSVTTVVGTLKGFASIKGANSSNFEIYGGDIAGGLTYTTTISGGNRTGVSDSADSAGDLVLKGGNVNVGNGFNNGGSVFIYGGDIIGHTTPTQTYDEAGGDITIVSGTTEFTNNSEKRSGSIYMDIANIGTNGTRVFGQINIGTGESYKLGPGPYTSARINIGTTTGSLVVNSTTTFASQQVNINSGSSIHFRDETSAPGASSIFMLKYYAGDLAIAKYPFGGGNTSYPWRFGVNNIFYASGISSSGSIYTDSGISINSGGNITAVGDVYAFYTSDQTLKTNIVRIDSALDKVNSLDGVTFNWNEQAKEKLEKDVNVREAGVIAQQVQAVLPEVVKTREDGTLAVKYDQMVPLLIEAIKELTSQVKDLQNQLNNK